MNENTKIEVAREILNVLIARYGKNGYDPNNEKLAKVLAAEKSLMQFDSDAIDGIIRDYGPIARDGE